MINEPAYLLKPSIHVFDTLSFQTEMVQIDGNQLGGTVPKEVCALTTKNLNSEIPDVIEFLKADCSNDNGTNLPFIHCDCCSVCCDHTTTQCINLKVV